MWGWHTAVWITFMCLVPLMMLLSTNLIFFEIFEIWRLDRCKSFIHLHVLCVHIHISMSYDALLLWFWVCKERLAQQAIMMAAIVCPPGCSLTPLHQEGHFLHASCKPTALSH